MGRRNGTLFIDVEEDAHLDLVVIQHLNYRSSSIFSILSRVGDGGRIELAHLEMGAVQSLHFGCDLLGFDAQADV